jgi:NAD(P)-dependent dehydrogenase (short-subunit alcohol dehydrogenase family)
VVDVELGLAGKVALITGGSRGIGRACAFAFAREGARVAICARRDDLLQETANEIRAQTGAEVLAVAADVTIPGDVEHWVLAVAERFGRIDILVNNAGRAHPGRFEQMTDDDWEADARVKQFSMIRCCRAVVPHMKAQGWGRIININATIGREASPGVIVASVNRAACIAFSKNLSLELASFGVTVNSVNVGGILTDQVERARQRDAPDVPLDQFAAEMAHRSGIPVGRLGCPEEVADLVVFLASERAAYITGASINIDGGDSRAI